jgi:hypothetical protein
MTFVGTEVLVRACKWSFRTFVTMYRAIRCPNPESIMNHCQCEHLKYCTTEDEELKCGPKCHTGKTELQKSSMFLRHSI